jgi:hypothetical protein
MGNFYNHNLPQAQKAQQFLYELAAQLHPESEAHRVAEERILYLIEICISGLPNCYASFTDMLYDFWPNFSWNKEKLNTEVQIVLADPRIHTIAKTIAKDWGHDMIDELKGGLIQTN